MQKLVRDRIPEIIIADGNTPVTRTLSDEEYKSALHKKLLEEGAEVAEASSKEESIEEIADVFEVLDAIMSSSGITKEEVAAAQTKKRDTRGGYTEKIFLEEIR